jgi:hypothetical protein
MLFVCVVTVFNYLIIWFMPKNLSRQEMYSTFGIVSIITISVDITLADTWLHLYEIWKPGIQISAVLVEAFLTPSFAVLYLNFMPSKRSKFVTYLLIWVIGSVVFEWLSVQFHYLTYYKWSIWYSFPIYLIVFLFLRWHINFLRKTKCWR